MNFDFFKELVMVHITFSSEALFGVPLWMMHQEDCWHLFSGVYPFVIHMRLPYGQGYTCSGYENWSLWNKPKKWYMEGKIPSKLEKLSWIVKLKLEREPEAKRRTRKATIHINIYAIWFNPVPSPSKPIASLSGRFSDYACCLLFFSNAYVSSLYFINMGLSLWSILIIHKSYES